MDVPDGDWIFGCDRRVWQSAFYSYFVYKARGEFCVQNIDKWLQITLNCKVPNCVKTAGILSRRHSQFSPVDTPDNLPSSWRTLRAYFSRLCELGILKFSGGGWFKVVAVMPKLNPTPEGSKKVYSANIQHIRPETLKNIGNISPLQFRENQIVRYVLLRRPFLVSPILPSFRGRRKRRL